jgi:microsomal epoxide hydrolase
MPAALWAPQLRALGALFPSQVPRSHWRDVVLNLHMPLLYVVTPQFAEQARWLKQDRPATRIEIFESAGHAVFADEPERFNTLIQNFVASLSH